MQSQADVVVTEKIENCVESSRIDGKMKRRENVTGFAKEGEDGKRWFTLKFHK